MHALLGDAQELDLGAATREGADDFLDQPLGRRRARGQPERAHSVEHRGLDVGDRIDQERARTTHPRDLDQPVRIRALLRADHQYGVADLDQLLDCILAVLRRVADVVGLRRLHRGETLLERLHYLARVVDAERGLGDGRDMRGIFDLDGARLGDGSDQHHFAGGDAQSALHFLVARMADENHGAAFVVEFFYFEMNLGDQRAGGVDYAQLAVFGAVPFAGRDAMRAEDDALAGGHLVEALDENRALAFERFEHEAVVNDLMAHVKRPAV